MVYLPLAKPESMRQDVHEARALIDKVGPVIQKGSKNGSPRPR